MKPAASGLCARSCGGALWNTPWCSESYCCCCWGSGAPCAAGSCCCHPALAPRLQEMQRVILLLLLLGVGHAVRSRLVLLPPCTCTQTSRNAASHTAAAAAGGRARHAQPAHAAATLHRAQTLNLCMKAAHKVVWPVALKNWPHKRLQAHDGETCLGGLPHAAAAAAAHVGPPHRGLSCRCLHWHGLQQHTSSGGPLQSRTMRHAMLAQRPALAARWSPSVRQQCKARPGHCMPLRLLPAPAQGLRGWCLAVMGQLAGAHRLAAARCQAGPPRGRPCPAPGRPPRAPRRARARPPCAAPAAARLTQLTIQVH